jgi:4-amino-4-deoxy-L-arabinose transferase-like glycosyltransferase
MPQALDWAIVFAILALSLVTAKHSGFSRGFDLMPWPDGLEYAAASVNLAKGRGAVLHFGGYTYPSRYTGGYPLILEFFQRIFGSGFLLFFVSINLGLLAILGVFILTRWLAGRAAGLLAALLLTLSPIFITYSTLVMSDVPTLFVTVCIALMLVLSTSDYASESPSWMRMSAWLTFGLLAGFSTIIRPTNATIFVGLALCVAMVPLERRDLRSLLGTAIAVAIGFAIPVAWQLHQNSINLGSAFASGYAWWVPEVYGAGGRTFSFAYLFGRTMPRNPHGNVLIYATTLLGLDGMLGDRGNPRYFLYPFAAAMFAMVGFVAILRGGSSPARRLMWFGIGYLAALTGLYCFYLFTDVAFILPGAFILFIAAGAGAEVSNSWMLEVFRARDRSAGRLAAAASVLILDLLLVVSLASEATVRLSMSPRDLQMSPNLQALNYITRPDSTVVSNISLQFLELALPAESRHFVGLNSLDPGEQFTDYHLHRLYEKRAAGWNGAVPPVVFDGDQMSATERDSLASTIGAKKPVYLLIAPPESPQYADVLKAELDQLQQKFTINPELHNDSIALYRLTARQ